MLEQSGLVRRGRAAGLHLLISGLVAAMTALLVFSLWYPGAYRLLAGGEELFLLVIGVDVALGPLLTFAVFDLKKGLPHLRRDLMLIGIIQSAALAYGIHTVYVARPVALVFEVDRLRVISANQVYTPELANAPANYRQLPLTGPWLLGTRTPEGSKEHNEALLMGVGGVDIAQRPTFWQPYGESAARALLKAKGVATLLARYPEQADAAKGALHDAVAEPSTAKFLPVIGHRGDWVAILDGAGKPVTFLPMDGFF